MSPPHTQQYLRGLAARPWDCFSPGHDLSSRRWFALIYNKYQSRAKRTTLENSKETGKMDPSFRRRCPYREQTLE